MVKYDDLLNEFNIENPEKKKRNPTQNSTKNSGQSSGGTVPQKQAGGKQGGVSGGNKGGSTRGNTTTGNNSGGNSRINTGNMTGVFGGGNVTAAPGRRIDWASVGARVRALPYASIICTIISIIMGLYIVVNFEAVTWAIFCFIYHLISVGLVIFVLIVIILALILSLRRRRRW